MIHSLTLGIDCWRRNKGQKIILYFVQIAALTLAGCSGKTSNESAPISQTNQAITNSLLGMKSTVEFRRHLKPGLGTNDILGVLGAPDRVDSWESQVMWDYSFQPFPSDEIPGHWALGMTISITNGRLAYVGFTHLGPTRKNLNLDVIQPLSFDSHEPPPRLQFYVVSDDQIDGGRYVDTAKYPKLGYIAATPDLVIARLVRITVNEQLITDSQNNQRTNWSFNLTLPEEFVPQLKALTETNISKRVLVMLGDEPVLAPRIISPLETTEISVSVTERSSMENMKHSISRMPQAGR